MKANMAKDETGQDLAVILFSGHGATIDGRFYLLPYGVDARTPADLEASAISADDFHNKVAELAKHGRVLVLLDACHSGAVTDDGSTLTSNADLLRSIATSNVTVLTSSTANEFSQEDEKWSHGAFTKVVRGGSALCHKILVGPRSASATAASMRLSWSSGIDAVERWRLPCPRIAQ
jgi:uncharacterized caspase-like protein